jgi:RNA polymerase sigma factor (sigma-70 family)
MKITDFPMLLVQTDAAEVVHLQVALSRANLVNPLRIVPEGKKAIAYLSGQGDYSDRDSHPFPSLVLLDQTLSNPSAPEVLAWIRSQPGMKHLSVILLSSAADPVAEPGWSGVLAKPVEGERLLELMKSLGMYWMLLDNAGTGSPAPASGGHRVLVVDRDADFLRGIGDALRRRTPPVLVEPALTPADALGRLARSLPDAVVVERGIAEADDFGFLLRVCAMSAELPVLILCAEQDETFAIRAIKRGATGVLFKTIRQDLFSDQLHGLLAAAKAPRIPHPPAWNSATAGPYRTHRMSTAAGRRQNTEILGKEVRFQDTAWDLVQAAPRKEAIDALIRIYWKPLYFFVRQRGFGNEEAKDIVQQFLASALESGMILKANPLRGRFRTFLLAALGNFIRDRLRFLGRQKRGGGQATLSLDLNPGEPRAAWSVRGGEPPETIIDRAWAQGLLGQCVSELEGKPSHLQAFELQMQGVDYAGIAKSTGLKESAAKTAVHRLRLKLRDIIRSHLSVQTATEEEAGQDVAEFATLLA